MKSFETIRLLLREWRENDLDSFAAITSDPKVMEFSPKPLSREETADFIYKMQEHFNVHGFGLYVCERKDSGDMIGYVGLLHVTMQTHFTPAVEVGWRLGSNHWGHGYATEAAEQVVKQAFTHFGLKELVSFTVPANMRSRRVMEKIGMSYNEADDFDHPTLAEGHPLRRHVLYRLRK